MMIQLLQNSVYGKIAMVSWYQKYWQQSDEWKHSKK